MLYQAISLVLYLLGAASAAAVILLSAYAVWKKHRLLPLLYSGIAIVYGTSAVRNLIFSTSPLACASLPLSMLLLSGFLFLLQLFFVWDILRMCLRKKELEKSL